MTKAPSSPLDSAKQIARQHGGLIRTAEALRAGIHPRSLYQMRDNGELEQLSRGVFRLVGEASISNPDLVIVATRIPQAVICLISAMAFHEITTQIPHAVSIALPRGHDTPRLDYPPIQVHRFSPEAYQAGIEEHIIDGISVKIYSVEKTLADAFKFRNKLGMDVVLEALKLYRERKKINPGALLQYARICRVENVIRPYLEMSL